MGGIDDPYIPDDYLFEKVNVSHQANEFLKGTPVGRALYDKALRNVRSGVEQFCNLSPEVILTSPEKVVAIQSKILLARAFIEWMDEIIGEGRSAETELQQRDQSEQTID